MKRSYFLILFFLIFLVGAGIFNPWISAQWGGDKYAIIKLMTAQVLYWSLTYGTLLYFYIKYKKPKK